MIGLDEDMVGSDPTEVVAQGLKVCLGLFARRGDGLLLGAHFTPITPLGVMDLIMAKFSDVSAGNLTEMTMVAKFANWTGAASGLTSPALLRDYFRRVTGFNGRVAWSDLTTAPASYDVRMRTDGHLKWRATNTASPGVSTPRADVFTIVNDITPAEYKNGQRTPTGKLYACDGSHRKAFHKPMLGGWFAGEVRLAIGGHR